MSVVIASSVAFALGACSAAQPTVYTPPTAGDEAAADETTSPDSNAAFGAPCDDYLLSVLHYAHYDPPVSDIYSDGFPSFAPLPSCAYFDGTTMTAYYLNASQSDYDSLVATFESNGATTESAPAIDGDTIIDQYVTLAVNNTGTFYYNRNDPDPDYGFTAPYITVLWINS